MKYIIIEDEQLAARRLRTLVEELRPVYKMIARYDSVEEATTGMPELQYDLVFMDIQLADGNSFDIFDQIAVLEPIIFTTAYDEYAIRAFKSNSVDYLLKPIDPKELEAALVKFETTFHREEKAAIGVGDLLKAIQPKGKERFIVRVGEHLKAIETRDIQLIFSQDKGTYIFTKEGRRYLIDYTLDGALELLSDQDFFKVSRKYIVNLHSVRDIVAFTNSRLELKIQHFEEDQVIVARERVSDFKAWIDR